MPEQEIKLHVPPSAGAGVAREAGGDGAQTLRLRAMYFDTPQRELVRARVALRLRLEGERWVQTLKAPGENAISRLEINHDRPGPELDLSAYAGTPVQAVFDALQGPLQVRYETDITRVARLLRTRRGTVELAWDSGVIKAGGLELPVSEVEFELVDGELAAAFELAGSWQQRHGLVADARSKAERGDALARTAQALADAGGSDPQSQAMRAGAIAAFWGPRAAQPVALSADMDAATALDAVTAECLDQIVRNAAVLAETDTAGILAAGTAEHVHQLRVGMRRLRSAWKLFEGLTELPPAALREQAREFFAAFGAGRDLDVLRDEILPALARAGMPAVAPPAGQPGGDRQALAAARAFQGWLLALQAWHLAGPRQRPAPTDAPGAALPLREALTRRLRKWHKDAVAQGARFEKLDTDARHALRKRIKRLRYGLSFAENLLPARRLRAYRKRLSHLQDLLGQYNDLAVARAYFESAHAGQPGAWFALGWIQARQEALAAQAAAACAQLARAPSFWK